MKRLWNCVERARVSDSETANFSDRTSFLSGGVPDHASDTRAVAGDRPGQTRRNPGHQDRIPRVARRIPAPTGGISFQTGGVPGLTGRAPGVSRRTPAVKRCAPAAARCVSGITGGVSGVDRCMEMKDLCSFTPFAIFPFGAVKQNTEKQQTTIEINKQT